MNNLRVLLVMLCALLGQSTRAEDAGPDGLTSRQLAVFLQSLQAAVKANDPVQLAALVSFPLRVNSGQGKPRALSAKQLSAEYARVFTPAVRAAILKQDAKTLFRNGDGAMVGDGEVWLAGICADAKCANPAVKIIAVNTGGL